MASGEIRLAENLADLDHVAFLGGTGRQPCSIMLP
jgi:hypothetical protein